MYEYELNHKEDWALKNWCFWILVLDKTIESILECKEIKPVNPKGNQSWIVIERTDAETETSILDAKSKFIGKDSDAEKGWRQKEKGGQRMRWLDSIVDSMTMNLNSGRQGTWHAAVHRIAKSWTCLSDCKTTMKIFGIRLENIQTLCQKCKSLTWVKMKIYLNGQKNKIKNAL